MLLLTGDAHCSKLQGVDNIQASKVIYKFIIPPEDTTLYHTQKSSQKNLSINRSKFNLSYPHFSSNCIVFCSKIKTFAEISSFTVETLSDKSYATT